jgi:hypothetical protein
VTELIIGANTGLISVYTSNSATFGMHTVTVVAKLTSYTTITSTLATFTVSIQYCIITSLQVVQLTDSGNLAAQSYTLSSIGILTYPLTTKQTPSCGYASTSWTVSAIGPAPANFAHFSTATSIYTVGPTTATSQTGTYTIQIASLIVNSVTYGSTSLVAPSSFILTVVNPCSGTTVTATSVSSITLAVWDLEAIYPTTGTAFSDFTDTISTTNSDPTMCAKTYTATSSTITGGVSLTNLAIDSSLKHFTVSSQNYNQIGTYTITLRGEITDYPS